MLWNRVSYRESATEFRRKPRGMSLTEQPDTLGVHLAHCGLPAAIVPDSAFSGWDFWTASNRNQTSLSKKSEFSACLFFMKIQSASQNPQAGCCFEKVLELVWQPSGFTSPHPFFCFSLSLCFMLSLWTSSLSTSISCTNHSYLSNCTHGHITYSHRETLSLRPNSKYKVRDPGWLCLVSDRWSNQLWERDHVEQPCLWRTHSSAWQVF